PRPAHAISSSVMFLASEMARMHHPPAPRPSRRSVILSGAAAALLHGSPLRASENRPMLTITEPAGKVRELSEQDIADLAWHEIATRTRWTDGVQTFRGPRLKDVLTQGGMTRSDLISRNLLMKALNDFGIVVPASDALDYHLIIAREMNGKMMRVRDKGLLWLISPRDQYLELQYAVVDDRWIWLLSEIIVL